jgi:KDO2-lipid IV(A) lauroyltransferase
MLERHLGRATGRPVSRRELRRAFTSYARYWAEAFRLPDLTPADLDAGMAYAGMEHIDAALAAGKGAVLAVPHLGGWEFGGAWIAARGYRLTVVVEPVAPPALFDWFVGLRTAFGFNVVPLGPHAGTEVLGALRRNELVCLLSDRDIGGGGVDVEFFGERTTLPGGPATMALRTGAALLPTAIYFHGWSGHLGVVRPPLPVQRAASLRADVSALTQRLAGELEGLIRRAPEQWHLLQPNWPSDREPARPD